MMSMVKYLEEHVVGMGHVSSDIEECIIHLLDLVRATASLREAQKAMADRSNDQLGLKMAEAAAEVDEVLATLQEEL